MESLFKKGLRRCWKCKQIKELNQFVKSNRRKDWGGYGYICLDCEKIFARERKHTWIKKHENDIGYFLSIKYALYKNSAKERNYNFNLTKEQFETFWQKPCYYCGSEIKTIGIDRIDNKIGYEIGNCVPCCGWCNKMKLTKSKEEFINHCNKIVNFNK